MPASNYKISLSGIPASLMSWEGWDIGPLCIIIPSNSHLAHSSLSSTPTENSLYLT